MSGRIGNYICELLFSSVVFAGLIVMSASTAQAEDAPEPMALTYGVRFESPELTPVAFIQFTDRRGNPTNYCSGTLNSSGMTFMNLSQPETHRFIRKKVKDAVRL